MSRKPAKKEAPRGDELYKRIREILESARTNVARTVNTTQVVANWLIGREIIEEEQKRKKRADYGQKLLEDLSSRLTAEYGRGYSFQNLAYFRQFFKKYPRLVPVSPILHALRGEFEKGSSSGSSVILHAVRGESLTRTGSTSFDKSDALSRKSSAKKAIPSDSNISEIPHAVSAESWKP